MAIEYKNVRGFLLGVPNEEALGYCEFASSVIMLRELKDGEEIGRDALSLNLEGEKYKVDLGDDNWKPLPS